MPSEKPFRAVDFNEKDYKIVDIEKFDEIFEEVKCNNMPPNK